MLFIYYDVEVEGELVVIFLCFVILVVYFGEV